MPTFARCAWRRSGTEILNLGDPSRNLPRPFSWVVYIAGLAKRCGLVVQHPRFRSGDSGEAEPVFFDIEKHHCIGDDSGGILMAAEIDLALDAIPGGHIKDEIFRKYIVSQEPVL
jgi:hypothetical protein